MRIIGWMMFIVATAAAGQIPVPQINLTGNIGCQGFPCVNSGTLNMTSDANRTMTAQETSAFYIKVTSSVSLTATRNLIAPAGKFNFTIENATSGGQSIQIVGASGTGVTIPNGLMVSTWNDGTNFVLSGVGVSTSNITLLTLAGTQIETTTGTPSAGSATFPMGWQVPNVPYTGTGDNSANKVGITVGSGPDGANRLVAMEWVADSVMSYGVIGTYLFNSAPVALRGSQMWLSGGSNFVNHPTCVPVIIGNVSQIGTDGTVINGLNVGTTNQFQVDCSGNTVATAYRETLFTPSSSSAACTAGQFADDANFHYVCTATNTWKRVALTTF